MMNGYKSTALDQVQVAQKKDSVLLLILAVSLILNVFLGWKVNGLAISRKGALVNEALSIGDAVPSIAVTDITGSQETIHFRELMVPTVLYVITPQCVWCERNFVNANALAKSSDKAFRFIGLSLTNEGLKAYVGERSPAFPIYANLLQNNISDLKLGSTPQTIVISPKGIVLKNWIGAYKGQLQLEIESYFRVKLPGIAESK
jgi:hypothetical protein